MHPLFYKLIMRIFRVPGVAILTTAIVLGLHILSHGIPTRVGVYFFFAKFVYTLVLSLLLGVLGDIKQWPLRLTIATLGVPLCCLAGAIGYVQGISYGDPAYYPLSMDPIIIIHRALETTSFRHPGFGYHVYNKLIMPLSGFTLACLLSRSILYVRRYWILVSVVLAFSWLFIFPKLTLYYVYHPNSAVRNFEILFIPFGLAPLYFAIADRSWIWLTQRVDNFIDRQSSSGL